MGSWTGASHLQTTIDRVKQERELTVLSGLFGSASVLEPIPIRILIVYDAAHYKL